MENKNIVIVKQGTKNYTFGVPTNTQLKKGDIVLCDTMTGEREGVCFTDSFNVDDNALEQILLLTGGYKPIKNVIGKNELVKFKDATQTVNYTLADVIATFRFYENLLGLNEEIIHKEVTEEESPTFTYKVGDKVEIIGNSCCHAFEIGEIVTLLKCEDGYDQIVWRAGTTDKNGVRITWLIEECDIKLASKQETPFYNGKVKCIESKGGSFFTQGHVYEFKNGCINDNSGSPYNDTPITDLSEIISWVPKFRKYKGE